MADKLDLESNPYETLGLGEGSAELTLPEIKKVRPRKQTAAASSRVRWLSRAAARAGVPAQGAGAAPRQAQVGAQPRCAPQPLRRSPESRCRERCCSVLAPLTRPGSRRAVAEREFNALQKAYELLWCARAQPLLCAAAAVGLRFCEATAHARPPTHAATTLHALRGTASPPRATPATPGRRARTRNANACAKVRPPCAISLRPGSSCSCLHRNTPAADLEARERDFATRSNDEEVARARLRNEIARLRRAAAERAARGGAPPTPFDDEAAPGGAQGPAAAARGAAEPGAAAAQQQQLQRTLKLVWNRGDGDYTAARLREARAAPTLVYRQKRG